MSAHTCYDIIPPSTKIVVFDTRLRVREDRGGRGGGGGRGREGGGTGGVWGERRGNKKGLREVVPLGKVLEAAFYLHVCCNAGGGE